MKREENHLEELMAKYHRHLQIKEQQMADYGGPMNAPSWLIKEKEDIEARIAELQSKRSELREIRTTDQPNQQTNKSSNQPTSLRSQPPTDPATVGEALELYLDEIGKSRASSTLSTYHYTIEKFKVTLAERDVPPKTTPLSAMSNEWMQWFLDDLRRLEPATERSYLAAVLGFYEYVVAKNWLELNLTELRYFVKRRQRKLPQKAQRFPKQQIEKLLQAMDRRSHGPFKDDREKLTVLRDRALFYLLADTGLRVSEACSLKRGHVDFDEFELYVTGKGSKEARIRISQRALARLAEYLEARHGLDVKTPSPTDDLPLFARHDKRAGSKVLPLSPRAVQQLVDRWVGHFLGEIYLSEITPHSFRHYFVTTVLRATGGDIEIAKKLARHEDISTTMRYAHLSDEELDEAYYDIFDE